MLSQQALCEKRHRKSARRKKLKAWRCRLMAQFGPMLGQQIYDKARRDAAGRTAPARIQAAPKPPPPPPPHQAPPVDKKPARKVGIFKRLFRRVVP